MNNKIYAVDFDIAQNFLQKFNEWLFFTDKIIKKETICKGSFYCVGPTDFGKEHIYNFDGVKKQDRIKTLAFVIHCIKNLKCNFVYENLTLMEDSDFWKTDMNYYFAESFPFFYIDHTFTEEQILQADILCGTTWGFVPFIIDIELNLRKIEPKNKIDLETEQIIIDNTVFFFTEIYDRGGLLLWVKDGYDYLIEELKEFI